MNNFKRLGSYSVTWIRQASSSSSTFSAERVEKSINQVFLLGRVGVDPQMRGSEERPVTIFTVATNTNFKDAASGDIQQKTEWHRISVFKPFLRDTVFNYLKKGQRCLIQGRLSYGQITDVNGVNHTTSTVVADDVIFFPKGSEEGVKAEDVVKRATN